MTPAHDRPPDTPPSAGIDRLVHEPARLHILTLLAVVENADFLFVLRQTGLTKGNLSAHLAKLESAGYVEIRKEFLRKMPHTVLAIAPAGRNALAGYRRQMAGLLGTEFNVDSEN